ncbi:MAG: hypothetical protein HYT94_01350 [Parcubacteria group bacterium]|nr:hypothetical protein [Parcubacteria group bacterium]
MKTKTKDMYAQGKADTALLFTVGLFFLTLALAVIYVSHFGLEPLPKSDNKTGSAVDQTAPAAAILAVSGTEIPPVVSAEISLNARDEEFFASLSKTAVKEIFIGSYGAVDKEILSRLRDEAEKTFGVKTTLLTPGAPVPKEAPFYDAARKQYDSDILLKSVEQSSMPYGTSVRFLYVVDFALFSSSQADRVPWFRATSGMNASLLSLHGLGAGSGSILARSKKLALRAIGATVGFDRSPSAADSSCLMYPAATLRELDEQKDAFCIPEADAISAVFLK